MLSWCLMQKIMSVFVRDDVNKKYNNFVYDIPVVDNCYSGY